MNPIYNSIKRLIDLKHYNRADIISKLDKFKTANLITQSEHDEMMGLMNNG